jgi:type IV secretion system protein TrbL
MTGSTGTRPSSRIFCETPRPAFPLPSPLVAGLCALLALIVISASGASASTDLLSFNPTATVEAQFAGWATQATALAQKLYLSLLIFELIALAVTTLLFRDNLGEFFASLSLKVFAGGVYFWFINNVGSGVGWPKLIVDMFKTFGVQLGGNSDPTWLGIEGVTAAGAYIAAGVVVEARDGLLATAAGFFSSGGGLAAMSIGQNFSLFVEGMGLMLLMATAAIWLQIILLTIESYIVMGAGVLFIGFAGSRFTMPFSQGYFSYMFNVGVKFMVVYLLLAIEQPIMHAILLDAAVTLGATFIPGAEYLALIPAAIGLLNVVICAALVWMIPGLAGSFLNGQSSASGSAVLSQAVGSMAAASNFMAQMGRAIKHEKAANSRGGGSAASQPNGGAGSTHHATAIESHPPGANGQPIAAGSEFAGDSGGDTKKGQAEEAERLRGYAMGSLAQGMPRDIGQPSAVQVRISNPDKL